MTILQNHIYKDILEIIVQTYNSKEVFIIVKYEIVQFALVSKYWFNSLYSLLNHTNFNSINNINNNNISDDRSLKYQLIKDWVLDRPFIFTCDARDPLKSIVQSCDKHKKVIAYGAPDSIDGLIKVLDKIPERAYLRIELHKGFNPNQYGSDIINHFNRINQLDYPTVQQVYSLLSSTPPKSIRYTTCDLEIKGHLELQFESTSKHPININDILFQRNQFAYMKMPSPNPNLKKFTLCTRAREMMNAVDSNASNASSQEQYSHDLAKWRYIINKLTNDPTLKTIKINVNKYKANFGGTLTPEDIDDGLKSLLANSKFIEKFTIEKLENAMIIEGLKLNTSIKILTLDFKFYYELGILKYISKIAPFNRTIRHLVIDNYVFLKLDYFLEYISALLSPDYKDQYELYSITFILNGYAVGESNTISDLVNYLQSNQFNVRQFNIHHFGKVKSSHVISKFNTIINVVKR